jgi:hypothetical protein
MLKLMKTKQFRVAAGLVSALAITGIALAYWSNTGAGTGTAAVGTNVPVTVKQTSTITGLYPGGPAQTLSGNFDNTNASKVYVAAVTATGLAISGAGAGATPACTAADFTLGGTAPVAAEVPAGTSQGSWTGLTLAMKDLGTNQDNCKGATVTITYASN